jgi:hypothetical protein
MSQPSLASLAQSFIKIVVNIYLMIKNDVIWWNYQKPKHILWANHAHMHYNKKGYIYNLYYLLIMIK